MRALVLAVLVMSTPAVADDDADVFFYAAGHVGLGLPMGAVGGELGVGLDWLRASGAIGRGFRGVNMSGMLRAVGEVKRMDLGVGLGISRGPGLHDVGPREEEDGPETQFGDDTRWLDLEVTFEFAVSDHAFIRFTAGMTHAFDVDCESPDAEFCEFEQVKELERSSYLPYVGIAGGIRFPEAPSAKPRYAIPVGPAPYPPPIFIPPY